MGGSNWSISLDLEAVQVWLRHQNDTKLLLNTLYCQPRELRDMGYGGRLRAAGPLVADQLRAARRVGFDEIELPEAMAERQPESRLSEKETLDRNSVQALP